MSVTGWRRFTTVMTLAVSAAIVQKTTAQKAQITWSEAEKPIVDGIKGLRQVPDSQRGEATRKLAAQIRELPPSPNQLTLAHSLANLSTEGDFGHDTLQQVAVTLDEALRHQASVSTAGMPEEPYLELATLVRYEHVRVPLDNPLLRTAMTRLEAEDQKREHADFTLKDLNGKPWTLSALKGKVVLVNFWATWCPPCRKEMPDLDAIYTRFRNQGLVILAISDEDAGKVKPFLETHPVSYPILLDPGRKVNEMLAVEGIPKSFVYDRTGVLAAEAIDMRTRGQLLEMLAKAGLK